LWRSQLDLGKKFHKDHIFPKSRFTRKKLTSAGIPADSIDAYLDSVNLLPNPQLLASTADIEKQDQLPPTGSVRTRCSPRRTSGSGYLEENDLDGLPLYLADYSAFYEQRKARVRDRLVKRSERHPRWRT
jgi:hypothetical protein